MITRLITRALVWGTVAADDAATLGQRTPLISQGSHGRGAPLAVGYGIAALLSLIGPRAYDAPRVPAMTRLECLL